MIVIIPGAFHKPAHYRKISEPLQYDGYEVMAVSHTVCGDNVDPEKTFFDDAAEIRKKLIPLFDQGRHAVIVSHSYGSLPATATVEGQTATERAERGLVGGITGVVSIAGFAFPARGKSIMGDDQIVPPPPYHIVQVNRPIFPLLRSDRSDFVCRTAYPIFKLALNRSFSAI